MLVKVAPGHNLGSFGRGIERPRYFIICLGTIASSFCQGDILTWKCTLLTLSDRNPMITGGFPSLRASDAKLLFCLVSLNKWMNKQLN